ncbi:hypothetical protein SSTU70S_04044 [Stutzerimonas stutzeri]
MFQQAGVAGLGAAGLGQVVVELRTQVDDARVGRKQLAVQRQAGVGMQVALTLEVPALRQVEAQLHQQDQSERGEQRLPARQPAAAEIDGERALRQIDRRRATAGEPGIGVVETLVVIHPWRRLAVTVRLPRRRALCGQRRPLPGIEGQPRLHAAAEQPARAEQ